MIVHCMTVAQLKVDSHWRYKIFVMESSNLILDPYFTYAKNEKRQKKNKKKIINNLRQVLKVLSFASLTINSSHNKKVHVR